MGKPKAPPPPDYSGIANASKESAELSAKISREQLQWAKEQYAQDREITDKVINDALVRSAENDRTAAADRERYETIFQPLEDDLAKDARDYASPEKLEAEAGRAMADVSTQFQAARTAATERLESFGIDPGQVRAGALDTAARVQEAASRAAAGNQARVQAEAVGRAMRSEAINVGRGYPGQIAGAYATALQSGQQGVQSGLNTTASGASTMGTGLQWTGAQNQSLGVWGNALTSGYNAQLAQFNANKNASSGIGGVLGMVGGLGLKLATGGMFEEGGVVEPGMAVEEAIPMERTPMAIKGRPPNHDGVPVTPEMSPSGGQAIDDVDAKVNVGEFIIPVDAVRWKGEEYFQKLIMKSRQDKAKAPAKAERMAIPV